MGFPVPSSRAWNLAVELLVLSSRFPIRFFPLPLTPATPEFRSESLPLRAPLARRCTHSLRCARQILANKLPAPLNYKSWGSVPHVMCFQSVHIHAISVHFFSD